MKLSMTMMKHTIFLIVLVATAVHGSPNGAPSRSCRSIYPHHGETVSQDIEDSAYELDISQLKQDEGYHPRKKYNRTCCMRCTLRDIILPVSTVAGSCMHTHTRACIN